MTFLSYLFVAAFILFWGGIFFGVKRGEKRPDSHYGFLFFTIVVMCLAGLGLSLGTLGLLPEITW